MTTMTFDKLAYIDRLKAVGFTEPQARGMADGLDQALREEVATKIDLLKRGVMLIAGQTAALTALKLLGH